MPVRVRPSTTAGLTAAISALCLVSGPAVATEPGFYAGVGVGEASYSDIEELNNLCTDYGITCTVDDKDTAYKVFAGYQFNNFIALEAGWVDLGTITAEASVGGPATIEADVAGVALNIVPQIPIGDLGAVFGKAGVRSGRQRLRNRCRAHPGRRRRRELHGQRHATGRIRALQPRRGIHHRE
jgi:hypothetical protein